MCVLKFRQRILKGHSRWGNNINCLCLIAIPRYKHCKRSRKPVSPTSRPFLAAALGTVAPLAESFSGAQASLMEAFREDGVTRGDEPRAMVQERERIWMERERRLIWVAHCWRRCRGGNENGHRRRKGGWRACVGRRTMSMSKVEGRIFRQVKFNH